MNAADQLRST